MESGSLHYLSLIQKNGAIDFKKQTGRLTWTWENRCFLYNNHLPRSLMAVNCQTHSFYSLTLLNVDFTLALPTRLRIWMYYLLGYKVPGNLHWLSKTMSKSDHLLQFWSSSIPKCFPTKSIRTDNTEPSCRTDTTELQRPFPRPAQHSRYGVCWCPVQGRGIIIVLNALVLSVLYSPLTIGKLLHRVGENGFAVEWQELSKLFSSEILS